MNGQCPGALHLSRNGPQARAMTAWQVPRKRGEAGGGYFPSFGV